MELSDAFSVRWSGENKWLFPPTYRIPKVLRHLQWSLAYGTLVVPWWPLLILPNNRFRSEVIDFLVVEPGVSLGRLHMGGLWGGQSVNGGDS